MSFIHFAAFRAPALAQRLAATIAAEVDPTRSYRLMEFCGGHTHAIFRYGLTQLLPPQVQFIHGPGCPVCVLPSSRLDHAIALATQHEITLCSYGDVLRVPASDRRSLLTAKAAGADIRVIYSPLDAVALARAQPERQIVFLAIGFETTTPPTAVALHRARAERLHNFSVFCNHVLTPAALRAILAAPAAERCAVDGILGPSHVSTIIGTQPYEFVVKEYQVPVVIAGFEPVDVLQSVLWLVRQCNAGRCAVENQYTRAVTAAGNRKAQILMAAALVVREQFEWRGLGNLPASGLQLAAAFADFDAELRFPVHFSAAPEQPGCACAAILRGLKQPPDCTLFGRSCRPEHPLGACMVSSEGACAAYWNHRSALDPIARPTL
jgi:hydrogenase expression/formation protein HypD